MPITLGLNIASLRSQRQLDRSSKELGSVFERLSSGQRINRASDDAAGLAIAESLNADRRVFQQGVRNLNDGLSVLNIADGALQELSSIVIRLNELAEQSANGTFGNQQRKALDEEAQALSDEYFRIVQSTEFNGRSLFTSDFGELRLQAGYGLEGSLSDGLGGAIGTGEFGTGIFQSVSGNPLEITNADVNGDGTLDLLAIDRQNELLNVFIGNGNGTFAFLSDYALSSFNSGIIANDFNNDGIIDVAVSNTGDESIGILLGNGDGTFQAETTTTGAGNARALDAGDFNGDGILDIATSDFNDDSVRVFLGNGDGSFTGRGTISTSNGPDGIITGDFNGDGLDDIASTGYLSSTLSVILSNGDGSFQAAQPYFVGALPKSVNTGDVNNDGILDLVTTSSSGDEVLILHGQGDGTFVGGGPGGVAYTFDTDTAPVEVELGDLNGDGNLDIITSNLIGDSFTTLLGNGDGTFQSGETRSTRDTANGLTIGDFTNDGVLDILIGNQDNTIEAFVAITSDGVSPLLEFSLETQADALQALPRFQQKLDQLATQRGEIGAFMARLETATNTLNVTAENYAAAESRIRDADIASESSQLTRLNILQQAASSVLAQANLQPQLALLLLGGG